MRAGAWRMLVACLVLAVAATGSAAQTSRPSPAVEGWTKSLLDDESYRRDGVIDGMPTCLLVAADDDAYGLWIANSHWHNMELPDLADVLYQRPAFRKAEPGFGTLIACTQILMAWHTSLPGHSRSRPTFSVDGRVEHGAVVIDLALGRHSARARIKPLPLVRLLTSPHLLPSWTYGGIVIRNAVIDGTLLLHNLHLSVPLAFANVTFLGGGYRKDVYKIDREVEAAISILHSRFQDHIMIAASEICGDVLINDSAFDEKVDWQDVRQTGRGRHDGSDESSSCKDIDDDSAASSSGVYVYGSTFRQSLRFSDTQLGTLHAFGNRFGRLLAWQTHFGEALMLSDNDIGSFEVSSHLATSTAINFNRIENDFFLFGHTVVDSAIESIDINSNRIGGGIGFSNFPPGVLPELISLESNHVGNGSLLCVPKDWRGTLSLDGSSYDGKLAIGLTRPPDPEADGDMLSDDSETLQCSWSFWEPKRFESSEDVYCQDLRSHAFLAEETMTPRGLGVMKVDLEAVEIRTLLWQLPLECAYRWSGFGLHYRLWQPADNAAKILSVHTGHRDLSPLRVFRAWRTTLWGHDPAPLDAMSRYLTENGAYNESREILLEAKRLNYAPACRPSENTLACTDRMMFGGRIAAFLLDPAPFDPAVSVSSSALADDIDTAGSARARSAFLDPWASTSGTESSWDRFRNTSLLLLLWPGGYGAKPERAVGLIAAGAVAFFLIYQVYACVMRRMLRRVPRQIARLTREPSHDPDQGPKAGGEEIEALRRLCEKATAGWLELDIERRLEIVRKDLIPTLTQHVAELSKPDQRRVKTLRRRLERFGNTEILGFSRFDRNKLPTRFTHWRYSVDTMLPFIDLHAYSNYYPEASVMRAFSILQHVIGWWLMTVFVASAAIL
ncbi:MAG: hypothetical protein R3F54_13600 [Alphaproteobacteria bacterium]